jgi:Fur family ferric uptake transcriptional regulator
MNTSGSLKSELNAKGWRFTSQREVILQLFENLPQGSHLSAEEVHELLALREERISLSTIYRTLKLMTRMKILRELELAEVHKHYELNTNSQMNHHHTVCIQCNMTIEFEDSSVMKQALKQVQKAGLDMLDCQLTIHTVCPEAIRKGWPAMLPNDWVCARAIQQNEKAKSEIK